MHILHIDCSPRRESHGRVLSATIVERLLEAAPGPGIRRRDLMVVEERLTREFPKAYRWLPARPHHHLPALAGA